jgi:hypothetical protein
MRVSTEKGRSDKDDYPDGLRLPHVEKQPPQPVLPERLFPLASGYRHRLQRRPEGQDGDPGCREHPDGPRLGSRPAQADQQNEQDRYRRQRERSAKKAYRELYVQHLPLNLTSKGPASGQCSREPDRGPWSRTSRATAKCGAREAQSVRSATQNRYTKTS